MPCSGAIAMKMRHQPGSGGSEGGANPCKVLLLAKSAHDIMILSRTETSSAVLASTIETGSSVKAMRCLVQQPFSVTSQCTYEIRKRHSVRLRNLGDAIRYLQTKRSDTHRLRERILCKSIRGARLVQWNPRTSVPDGFMSDFVCICQGGTSS